MRAVFMKVGQPHMPGQVLHCIVSDAPGDVWCPAYMPALCGAQLGENRCENMLMWS